MSKIEFPAALRGVRIGLAAKLSAAFVLVAVVAVLVVARITQKAAEREFTDFILGDKALSPEHYVPSLVDHFVQHESWDGVEQILTPIDFDSLDERRAPPMLLADARGEVVAITWGPQISSQLTQEMLDRGWPVQVDGETVGTLVTFGARRPPSEMILRRVSPEGAATLARIRGAILMAVVVAAVIALVIAGLLAWGMVRPLRRLTSAADAIAQGDLAQRVPVSGGDEMADLAAAFNHMANELQRVEQLRRDMTTDVAHELRTPLSVIRSHVEALQDGVFELTTENLAPIHDRTLLLSRLVEDLRELALAEAGQLPMAQAPTDARSLVETTIQGFRAQAEKRGVDLKAQLPDDLPPVHADRARIGQVLTNLLSNALRHTPSGGSVTVSATLVDSGVQFSIADSGEGITPEDLPNVFERFYRGDRARERLADGEGTGLGLAIARSIVQAHGESINVESVLGQGSVFSFYLPSSGTNA